MKIQRGDLVQVKAYGGKVIAGRVVEVRGRSVAVTTKEEYEAAAKERREPICIGFPLSDVAEEKPES
jgi:hypothetical protein